MDQTKVTITSRTKKLELVERIGLLVWCKRQRLLWR